MIKHPINKILFYDIETVPISPPGAIPDRLYEQWNKRYQASLSVGSQFNPTFAEHWEANASFEPEFAKIAAISYGYFDGDNFKVRSICNADEESILVEFKGHLQKFASGRFVLGGHNIKEFDTPFLAKRFLLNGIRLPDLLNNAGKKPWEIYDVDTMEIWRMGSFKAKNVGLELLSAAFNVPSPKESVDGSMVGGLFATGEYEKIAKYCAGDVVTVARVVQRMMGDEYVQDEKIIFI